MKVRFQADVNLDGRLIRGLKRLAPEIDIQTATDSGLDSVEDAEVLRRAGEANRILISQDRRTMPGAFRQYAAKTTSPGVILLREGISIAAAIDDILLIWSASQADEWTNRLVWILYKSEEPYPATGAS